jgi:AraC-like DNA-binding protein
MEIYRASSLPRRARAAGWSDLYSSHVERADVVPADEAAFDAELKLATLGPIRIARLSCGGSTLDRTPRHISPASARSYTFILQARGSGRLAHYGHEVQLHEGDLTLCDSAAPHSWQVTDRSEVVMLRVPAQVLREYLPSPEYFCGRHLPAAKGLTSTVASLALSLCSQWETWLPADLQDRVARHLLELIATSYAMAFDTVATSSSVITGRHAKVKLYIEQHLRDPSLSPCSIAQNLKLSARYLRMIFATSKETVSAYVLRRRLEECARQMADPRWRGHSISEIAFAWGFNSASHFTRCFRERYGQSPRDYRREQLDPDFGLVAPAA